MALIKCPECSKEISDKAASCPNCGCPVSEMSASGVVRIKMPTLELGLVGLFSSRDATVLDSSNNVLWKGRHSENASFTITGETEIVIKLGRWANEIRGSVAPRKKYSLVQDLGAHMFATYTLTEVDLIDADR